MKVLAILILWCFVACFTDEDKANECRRETKHPQAFDSAIKAYQSGNFVGLSDEAKCIYKCILIKKGVMTEAGVLNLLKFKERFLKAAELTEKCNNIKEKTPCDTGFEVAKCVRDIVKILKD